MEAARKAVAVAMNPKIITAMEHHLGERNGAYTLQISSQLSQLISQQHLQIGRRKMPATHCLYYGDLIRFGKIQNIYSKVETVESWPKVCLRFDKKLKQNWIKFKIE